MHLLVESNAECERLAKESKDYILKLLESFKDATDPVDWPASGDLAQSIWQPHEIYLLKEGIVRFSLGGQLFILFEEGDLLGLDLHRNLQNAQFSTDFKVRVERISLPQFLKQTLSKAPTTQLWIDFLNRQARLFLQLNSALIKGGLEPQTQLRSYGIGDVIIEQGSQGTSVFHMVSGSAEVLVDGVSVGEVKENEIFGLISALANTPRSATVKARTDCTTAILEKEQFHDLIRSRPDAFLKVCTDMADIIARLNKQVVGLTKGGKSL